MNVGIKRQERIENMIKESWHRLGQTSDNLTWNWNNGYYTGLKVAYKVLCDLEVGIIELEKWNYSKENQS